MLLSIIWYRPHYNTIKTVGSSCLRRRDSSVTRGVIEAGTALLAERILRDSETKFLQSDEGCGIIIVAMGP